MSSVWQQRVYGRLPAPLRSLAASWHGWRLRRTRYGEDLDRQQPRTKMAPRRGTESVDERCPEKLEDPGQRERAKQADDFEARAGLAQGETLLVHAGAGGVGSAAIQLGKAMGARVIAAASTAEKLAVCKERGADELINYSTEMKPGDVFVIQTPAGGGYGKAVE